MAYGTRYTAGVKTLGRTDVETIIYIDEDGFSNPSTALKIVGDSAKVRNVFNEWESPIIGRNFEMTIQNTGIDFFDFIELMYGEEKKYRIRVEQGTVKVFQGFLNTENTSQNYNLNSNIKLTASSYISKLKDEPLPSLETVDSDYLINIIDEILRITGAEYDIMVNCHLFENTDYSSRTGRTAFNQAGIFNEIFWENNVDKKDCWEVLETILTPFNCYIYWYDDLWYIERYRDINYGYNYYVKYTTGVTYDNNSTGLPVTLYDTQPGIHGINWKFPGPKLNVIPGMRRVVVNLDDQLFLNLVVGKLDSIIDSPDDTTYPSPDFRVWEKYKDTTGSGFGWYYPGTSYKTIANQITRGMFIEDSSGYVLLPGIYTKFSCKVESGVTLSITFKASLSSPGILNSDSDVNTFYFHWFLRNGGSYYVEQDSEGVWSSESHTWNEDGIQAIVVEGSEMEYANDVNESYYTARLEIPIGDLTGAGAPTGNTEFVFGICTELVDTPNAGISRPSIYPSPCNVAHYGDIIISATSELADNVIKGDANTSFLNTKDISMMLYDIENVSYKNGLLRSNLLFRTDLWTEDGVTVYTLAQWLILAKFQLYNESRQKITGSFVWPYLEKPFMLWYDNKQSNKPFLFLEYTYNFKTGQYESVGFYEYDNSTTINFI